MSLLQSTQSGCCCSHSAGACEMMTLLRSPTAVKPPQAPRMGIVAKTITFGSMSKQKVGLSQHQVCQMVGACTRLQRTNSGCQRLQATAESQGRMSACTVIQEHAPHD